MLTNSVKIAFPYRLPKRIKYHDRASTQEELGKMIDLANIREKVIISILALTGLRIGTLIKLQVCPLETTVFLYSKNSIMKPCKESLTMISLSSHF